MNKAMENAIKVAEKNVQWGAMGLGVLFLGYMGYKYFGSQPAAMVGGEHVGAGEIDRRTASQQAAALEGKLNGSQSVKFEVPTFDGKFRQLMSGPTTQPLATAWTTSFPLDLTIKEGTPTPAPVPEQPGEQQPEQLTELPAPATLGTTVGVSTVDRKQLVAAAQQQPGGGGGGGQALPAGVEDIEWVTGGWEIAMPAIAQAFQDDKIRPGLQTHFLRVIMEREELMPDGSWGNRVTVPPLQGGALALNPMPAVGGGAGNQNAESQYDQWAQANQVEILQPGFYSVLAGQHWKAPGGEQPAAGGPEVFDPNKYLTGPMLPEWTKEQREAVLKARQAADKARQEEEKRKREERARNRPSGPPSYPPPGGGPPGGYPGGRPGSGGPRRFEPAPKVVLAPGINWSGAVAIADAVAPLSTLPSTRHGSTTLIQFAPPRPPYLPPGVPWPPPGYPGSGTGPGGMPHENAPNNVIQNNLGQVPSGPFDPLAWQGASPRTFQHDETILPGKTYRYRAKYVLFNPVYQQPAAVKNKALANQFGWESKWSDWTAEVNIPPKVSFFVTAQPSNGASSLSVEVFRYIKGQMKSQKYSVNPGDVIGANDANGDFNTGYVLVDIRSSSNGGYALVMGPDGKVIRRTGKEDRQTYDDMKKMLAPATPPTGATGPGAGGPIGG